MAGRREGEETVAVEADVKLDQSKTNTTRRGHARRNTAQSGHRGWQQAQRQNLDKKASLEAPSVMIHGYSFM